MYNPFNLFRAADIINNNFDSKTIENYIIADMNNQFANSLLERRLNIPPSNYNPFLMVPEVNLYSLSALTNLSNLIETPRTIVTIYKDDYLIPSTVHSQPILPPIEDKNIKVLDSPVDVPITLNNRKVLNYKKVENINSIEAAVTMLQNTLNRNEENNFLWKLQNDIRDYLFRAICSYILHNNLDIGDYVGMLIAAHNERIAKQQVQQFENSFNSSKPVFDPDEYSNLTHSQKKVLKAYNAVANRVSDGRSFDVYDVKRLLQIGEIVI